MCVVFSETKGLEHKGGLGLPWGPARLTILSPMCQLSWFAALPYSLLPWLLPSCSADVRATSQGILFLAHT